MDLPDNERLLNSKAAVEMLQKLGVDTSRRTLDAMRAKGELKWISAKGRTRILYRRTDLIEAFLSEGEAGPETPSRPEKQQATAAGKPSREVIFARALEAARKSKRT